MRAVGLVGQGAQFETLGKLLEATSTKMLLWQPPQVREEPLGELPPNVEVVSLERLAELPLIFFLVPIQQAREVARMVGDVVSGRQVIVHMSRSLEAGSLKSVSALLKEETSTQRFGYLTGPMIYDDVQANRVASGVCASLFPEVHNLMEECLKSQRFRLYRTEDILGAEVASAYVRVLAVIAGIVSKLELGTSLQATLFARGLAEAARFVTFCGGYERTVFGLSGVGNLYADTHMEGSVAYKIGTYLAAEDTFDTKILRERFGLVGQDLLALLETLSHVSERADLELHILRGAHKLLNSEHNAREALQDLMKLPAQFE